MSFKQQNSQVLNSIDKLSQEMAAYAISSNKDKLVAEIEEDILRNEKMKKVKEKNSSKTYIFFSSDSSEKQQRDNMSIYSQNNKINKSVTFINNNENNEIKNNNNVETKNEDQDKEQEHITIKETIINSNTDNRILPDDENIITNTNNNKNIDINANNPNQNQEEKQPAFDYLITIQYTKFLRIPYFRFKNLFHFYFPFKSFQSNQIKLSEIPTPPFAVIRSECK